MPTPIEQFRARIDGVVFGGDYNPEQWPEEVWRQDIALMQEAGVNLVSLGIFAWTSLEPRDGDYTFDWLDRIMDQLHEGGISVNLATPTAAPPAWFSLAYPDSLPLLEDGSRLAFGARAHYDPSDADYRRHAARITTRIAERYAEHPALAMWHIGNEYGTTAYGPAAADRFRTWLQDRYGSLEALNDAWTTRFWGQHYSDWAQVGAPGPPRGWSNPARKLDFNRFTSDMLLECFQAERDIVRSFTPDVPVLTNFMRFYGNADYWTWAAEEDAVALDIYPNPGVPDSHIAAALNFDLMRSLRQGQPWLLMEQSSSAVSQWHRNHVKQPGRMRLGSYQAMAHGADAVMFFQWRASVGGSERFHSAMLPHSGTESRTWREVSDLGGELQQLSSVVGTRSTAKIAICFDWESWWALGLGGLPTNDFVYPEMVLEFYRPLWERNYAIDIVHPAGDLSSYDLVIMPNAYLTTKQTRDNITSYLRAGGTMVINYCSGVVDDNNRVWPDGYPGALRELIGAHIHEYWPAKDTDEIALSWSDGTISIATRWQEDLHLETATALATYPDGALQGQPAVITNAYGNGRVLYLGTDVGDDQLARLLTETAQQVGVEPLCSAPAGVEVTRRTSDEASLLFVLNHTDRDQEWQSGVRGVNLLDGTAVKDRVTLAPADVLVIAEEPLPEPDHTP